MQEVQTMDGRRREVVETYSQGRRQRQLQSPKKASPRLNGRYERNLERIRNVQGLPLKFAVDQASTPPAASIAGRRHYNTASSPAPCPWLGALAFKPVGHQGHGAGGTGRCCNRRRPAITRGGRRRGLGSTAKLQWAALDVADAFEVRCTTLSRGDAFFGDSICFGGHAPGVVSTIAGRRRPSSHFCMRAC